MITEKEFNELITLIANLRDESIAYGKIASVAIRGEYVNTGLLKYNQKQMDNATQVLVDYLKGIIKN